MSPGIRCLKKVHKERLFLTCLHNFHHRTLRRKERRQLLVSPSVFTDMKIARVVTLLTLLAFALGDVVPSRCFLKPDPGPCKGSFKKWFFNPQTKVSQATKSIRLFKFQPCSLTLIHVLCFGTSAMRVFHLWRLQRPGPIRHRRTV